MADQLPVFYVWFRVFTRKLSLKAADFLFRKGILL